MVGNWQVRMRGSHAETTGGGKPNQPKRESEEDWLRNECHELFSTFSHRCLDAIIRATRTSLDQLKKRVFVQRYVHVAFECTYNTLMLQYLEL